MWICRPFGVPIDTNTSYSFCLDLVRCEQQKRQKKTADREIGSLTFSASRIESIDSEIFGEAECEIIHFVNCEIFCCRRKWNKIRSITCEAHFTLRSNISLPQAISLVPKERISLKRPRSFERVLFMAPLVGLEPTTCGLTVRRSTDWAKEEYLCWHYLSSRAVARQVLSARMSLTSVFGMGTGGPSSQSIPTMSMALNHLCICQKWGTLLTTKIIAPRAALVNTFSSEVLKMVTHTGFEPMLTAWEAAVLTTWPTGHWCTFTDSNRGPTD